MQQIFIFGSSSTYGVGGTKGGWADLLKKKIHSIIYSEDGLGEKFEVFNFGKSGATIDFVQMTYPMILENYGRDCKKIALVNVGGNNSKAVNTPDNYVSTPEEYQKAIKELLENLKRDFYFVMFIGSGYVDESKTNPKQSPFGKSVSYFTNERKKAFEEIAFKTCADLGLEYVGVSVPTEEWLSSSTYKDGLHANDHGYQHIFENIWGKLKIQLDT